MATEGMAGGEQWLADYTRRVGEIQRKAQETQDQIKNMRARASSPDGAVTVVLAPGGRLESLALSPASVQLGHQRLAAAITQTIQAAHADAAAQTQAALQPLVGESDAMEFLKDQVDSAIAEDPAAPSAEDQPQPPQQPPRRASAEDGDDEDFGGSIMRSV
ncbi:YbaB/EbfC family nucleoid-associated protein [Amycolatopsis magusensis]|uniref:YbaB/EbfC family nucleoid-associated protein n=1 Tax=Amycolatopsis magusensis TaxID=882444 RepID=UPI0024A9F22F|nr:YbaB/EbfC family nucleoid-associated protein [Amycolatopsis magusensis]MDI5978022.1 YbaB/EbfC family nucleoid-associated protein [Amycolatopsis magusensis]